MNQIGRYAVVRELGRGAMGIVYEASDPVIGRTVAIKTIRMGDRSGPEREELRARLRREAQSAGILSHPGITTIHDVGEHGDEAFIVMEFVDGPTLEHLLNSDTPPTAVALVAILKEAAAALDYAHGK